MNKLFYIVFTVTLIIELQSVWNPSTILDMRNKYKKVKGTDVSDWPQDIKNKGLENLMYFALLVTGLFTFQWWAFASLLLLSLIPKPVKFLIVMDGVISFLIILFIIINKFHFHYTPF